MSLAQLSVTRPVTTLMFYTGVVLLGVVAFTQLSVDFLPPIKIPRLTVHTSYPKIANQNGQPFSPTKIANSLCLTLWPDVVSIA
jgi:Cu/Ag efflux pump CusA